MLKTIKNKKGVIGSAISMLIYILTLKYYFDKEFLIHNTIDGIQFGLFFMILGLAVSLLIFVILRNTKILASKYITGIVSIVILIIPLMIVFKFGYQINKTFGQGEETIETAKILKMTKELPFFHYKVTVDDNKINTLEISKELWYDLKTGDSIVYKVRNGYFGYKIILDINKSKVGKKKMLQ